LDGIEINNLESDGLSEWREKHRLAKIVSEISIGKRSKFWTGVFIFFNLTFFVMVATALISGAEADSGTVSNFASFEEFQYEGSSSLGYASCSLSHDLKDNAKNITSLADFSFLSGAAYLNNDEIDKALDEWFGDTEVENMKETVKDFQEAYQKENGPSAVSYKLFNFPNSGDLKIVSVRGTSNMWDSLTDAQLWGSAFLAQLVRNSMPLGGIWTPVLPQLVKVVSNLQEKAIKDVSYYKETSALVKMLKDEGFNVRITGHSLGGGLAMVTGAQEGILSVGISGPNNLISRKAFDPPVTSDDLDTYTFNVVPEMDPVPRIDDLSQNYQRIKCRADPNHFLDCHSNKRSLCELLYTCGSSGRPIPCECVSKYGYPKPTSINNASYSDYCP